MSRGPSKSKSKTTSKKDLYSSGKPSYILFDESIQREMLINQRRKAHTCWAIFFAIMTIVFSISLALPGVHVVKAVVSLVYPAFGDANVAWTTSFLAIVCAFFGILSTFFACRPTPTLQKMQSTGNPEDAYRASLLGLGMSKDARMHGAARMLSPGALGASGSNGSNGSTNPSRGASQGGRFGEFSSSSSSSSSPAARQGQGGQTLATPGSRGDRRRDHSRGRQSSGRGSTSSHRRPSSSIQSPISRLVSGFNGVKQWSTDRAREVASMSPIGRSLDVDLLDRRTGIDSPEMLDRYLDAFQQQRQVQQQRSGFRNALDPNAQPGRMNRRLVTYRSGQRKRSTPSSRSTSTSLSKPQLAEEDAKAERQYKEMGINDYIDNWQANLRQVFARILINSFLRPFDRSNQDLSEKGVEINLLEHSTDTQNDFSDMRDKLKELAKELYNDREMFINHPDFHTNQMVATRQAHEAQRLYGRLLDRLDSNFQDYNHLDLRILLYRCSDQVKAHNRHRKEQRHGTGNARSASNTGIGGGVSMGAVGGGSSGGGLLPGGGGMFGGGGGGMLGGGGNNGLVPVQTPGMAMGASGVMEPTTNLFQSTTVTTDYQRLFYCFFLSPRRDPISDQLVNLIEERERLEKYLLVPSMPEQSRGYVLKRIRELTKDRRFGEMNWKGGGVYKNVPWTAKSKLPSDVEIILHFFFAHVELHLHVKGFAAKYKLTGDDLEQRHSVGPDLCVVERRTMTSSHVQVICRGKEYAVRSGRDNVFEALALFLYFVNDMYQGMLDNVDLYKHMCMDEIFDDSRGLGGLMTM